MQTRFSSRTTLWFSQDPYEICLNASNFIGHGYIHITTPWQSDLIKSWRHSPLINLHCTILFWLQMVWGLKISRMVRILVSYDVTSLFINVPFDETIIIIDEKAFQNSWFNAINKLNISKSDYVNQEPVVSIQWTTRWTHRWARVTIGSGLPDRTIICESFLVFHWGTLGGGRQATIVLQTICRWHPCNHAWRSNNRSFYINSEQLSSIYQIQRGNKIEQ